MTELRRRTLLGLDFVDAADVGPVIDAILAGTEPPADRLPVMVTPNVDILVKLAREADPAVVELYRRAQFVLPDGQPVVWLSKRVGAPLTARLPGSTLFARLWVELVAGGRSALVIASSERVAATLRQQHPGVVVVVPPIVDPGDRTAVDSVIDQCLAAVGDRRPEFVFAGLGMPKDAVLVNRLFARWPPTFGPLPQAFCLGGSFEMHVGIRRRAPLWVQRAGMEWFFRFSQEPRRLFRRYFLTDSYFLVLAIREIQSRAKKSTSSPASASLDAHAGTPTALRIAYLTGEYPRATDTFIQREVSALRSLGVDVQTFAVRRPGAEHLVGDEQRGEAARTTYLLPTSASGAVADHANLFVRSPRRYLASLRLAVASRRPGMGASLRQVAYVVEAGVLARHLQRRGVAHVHNHFADSSCTVAMLSSSFAGIPFSFTLHGPGIFFRAHEWRLDLKLANAAFCACISWFARAQAAIFAPPGELERLHIVHCGVDTEDLAPRRHVGKGSRLLFVGRLAREKGVEVLLDAFSRISAERPDLSLTVVGDGPERSRLERRAMTLGVSDSVSFTGYRNSREVSELLSAVDVFVLPSFAEGVPVTLMEALGAGVPVVATAVGGVGELVKDGDNGFLVPPGDAAVLAERIGALLDDGDLRAAMGVAGRALVRADFNSSTEAARLRVLFEGVAASAR